MHRSVIAIVLLFAFGCGNQPLEEAVIERDPSEPIATEAHISLSAVELARLRQSASSGDVQAMDRLINYYWVNYGDQNEEAIYWQLQAARRGNCEHWEDLMFMEEDGFPVPGRFFSEGETLRSIGESNGCPPYRPQLNRHSVPERQ